MLYTAEELDALVVRALQQLEEAERTLDGLLEQVEAERKALRWSYGGSE